MMLILSLLCLVFSKVSALQCSLHFYPSLVCHHYNYDGGCTPGLEHLCDPVKITYQNPRCPTYICVSFNLAQNSFKCYAVKVKPALVEVSCQKITSFVQMLIAQKLRHVLYSEMSKISARLLFCRNESQFVLMLMGQKLKHAFCFSLPV